jgi:aminomethyltransferase
MELIGGFSSEIPSLKRYRFTIKKIPFIAEFIVSRTGYTGEDGVEASLPAKFAGRAVDMMLKNVSDPEMIKPAGLGARDSLRLEAGMPLYGHELEEHFDPISAGLNFAVRLDKSEETIPGGFIGQKALQKIAQDGPRRKLTGLVLEGKRAARQNMRIMSQDGKTEVGFVTSGCWSPTLEKSIAMGYVESALAAPGNSVIVDPEKLNVAATTCAIPFYKSS